MSPFDCRKHHWFPATFIPEIPFTLIEVLTQSSATVYDPFAGIGTTYFQALLLSRKPMATENCTVAVDFMKSLFVLFDPSLDFELIRNTVEQTIEGFDSQTDYVEKVRQDNSFEVLIDELQNWYHPNVLNQIAYLILEERYCPEPATKAAIHIALSAILKKTSSQDRGWGCIADNVRPKKKQIDESNAVDAIRIFRGHLNRLLQDVNEHLKYVSAEYPGLYAEVSRRETIFHADTRYFEGIRDGSVDLVVTSPTYPNMTDYVTSQRLSYYWLGVNLADENQDLPREIGARRKRHVKNSIDQYLADMKMCNEILSRKIAEGGYVCFVMPEFGNSKPNDIDRKVVTQQVVYDLSKHLVREKEFERVVPAGRRAQNIKWATLEREKIHIFRRRG